MTDIKESLVECGAVMFGDFTLSSGKKSRYYIDIKKASTDPLVLHKIAAEMAHAIRSRGIQFDKIGGVVLGSIPLAVALSLATKVPFVMIRKDKKDHGTQKMIEGVLSPGEKVLMVEDVITSASSVAEAIEIVRKNGGEVEHVFAVVDRQEGGEERLKNMNVELASLVTAEDLLRE